MTMLRDQLSALADSVDVPPAPSLFELSAMPVRFAATGGSAWWRPSRPRSPWSVGRSSG